MLLDVNGDWQLSYDDATHSALTCLDSSTADRWRTEEEVDVKPTVSPAELINTVWHFTRHHFGWMQLCSGQPAWSGALLKILPLWLRGEAGHPLIVRLEVWILTPVVNGQWTLNGSHLGWQCLAMQRPPIGLCVSTSENETIRKHMRFSRVHFIFLDFF